MGPQVTVRERTKERLRFLRLATGKQQGILIDEAVGQYFKAQRKTIIDSVTQLFDETKVISAKNTTVEKTEVKRRRGRPPKNKNNYEPPEFDSDDGGMESLDDYLDRTANDS